MDEKGKSDSNLSHRGEEIAALPIFTEGRILFLWSHQNPVRTLSVLGTLFHPSRFDLFLSFSTLTPGSTHKTMMMMMMYSWAFGRRNFIVGKTGKERESGGGETG